MLLRKDCLIVTVDDTGMSIFQNIGEAFAPELALIEEHHNPSQKTSELATDKPGRTFQSKTFGPDDAGQLAKMLAKHQN